MEKGERGRAMFQALDSVSFSEFDNPESAAGVTGGKGSLRVTNTFVEVGAVEKGRDLCVGDDVAGCVQLDVVSGRTEVIGVGENVPLDVGGRE
jgi:hypothetical protein